MNCEFAFIVFIVFCSTLEALILKDSNISINNCMTWHDDQMSLIITCRVGFPKYPVSIIHKSSNTNITCFGENTQCLPKEKNVSLKAYDDALTIILHEDKSKKNLDGNWLCVQGKQILTTTVSLSKGILVDAWVQLRGKTIFTNGTRYIDLECSSCRKPDGLVAEFIVNNETFASVWMDDYNNCLHKGVICSSNKCNCSPVANMFSIRLKADHLHTETVFSCEMTFKDELRGGRFFISATEIYRRTDFSVKGNEFSIIKRNAVPTGGNTANTTRISSDGNEYPNVSSKDTGIGVQDDLRTYILVTLLVFVTVWLLAFVFMKLGILPYTVIIQRKEKKDLQAKNKNEPRGKAIEMDLSECQEGTEPLIRNLKKQILCRYCQLDNSDSPADFLCLDCRHYFCSKCFNFHRATEDLEAHIYIKVNLVPDKFDVSMFSCSLRDHNASALIYFCIGHALLCCRKCISSSHSNCKKELLYEIETHLVCENTKTYIEKLNTLKTEDPHVLCQGCTDKSEYENIENNTTLTESSLSETSHTLLDAIYFQIEVLNFLLNYDQTYRMAIAVRYFTKRLSSIKTDILSSELHGSDSRSSCK